MPKCNVDNCKNERWEDREECVLHCAKGTYSFDFESNLLPHFYDALVEYIVEKLIKNSLRTLDQQSYRQLFSWQEEEKPEYIPERDTNYIYLYNIWFPESQSIDANDYVRILLRFRALHFDSCTFSKSSLELFGPKVFFNNCFFEKSWNHHNFDLLENASGFIYSHCIFESDVDVSGTEDEPFNFVNPIFYNCRFLDSITAHYANFESLFFEDELHEKKFVDDGFAISIVECEFKSPFVITSQSLRVCVILASRFLDEIRINKSKIGIMFIKNCQFKQPVLLVQNEFSDFDLENSSFADLVSFEESIFGQNASDSSKAARFQFVTFLSFCSFSETKFHCGLKLHRVSIKEAPNFLGVNINHEKTDRETYRIIKNSFDKVGNYIEGNRFYKFEMLKRGEELSKNHRSWERFVYELYKYSSDFGQSIGRPLFWIVISAVIYSGLLHSKNEDWLYKIIKGHVGDIATQAIGFINQLTKGIIPFKRWLEPGMEFLSLIFYIIFTSLIWLVILAIKRHTKR